MELQKYISSEGLGLLPEKERRAHLRAVLKKRVVSLKKIGFSHREALRLAMMGEADGGMPDYRYRGCGVDVYPASLLPPPTFEFTNNLSNAEGQKVIDAYLERYPKPTIWTTDEDE